MNNVFLFIGCLIEFIIAVISNKRSISSPAVLFSMGFLISSFMLMINTNIWEYEILNDTCIYILIGNACFILACLLFKSKSRLLRNNTQLSIDVSLKTTSFILFFVIVLIGIYSRLYVLIYFLGTSSLENQALGEIRHGTTDTPVDNLLKIVGPCISAIAIFAIMYFFSDLKYRKKINKMSLLLMAGYFIFSVLSSARIEVIYLFVFLLVYYILLFKRDTYFGINLKLMLWSVLFVLTFFSVFFLLGFLTGKSQGQSSVFNNISLYTGSSIGGLNEYIKSFHYYEENMFTSSFKGIYTLLGYLGIHIDRTAKGIEMGYFHLGNMDHNSNVYTCYYNLLHDFNYFGTMIFIFIEGMVYQLIYNRARISLLSGKAHYLLLYVYITAFIMLSSIADRFFAPFLTISTIAFILFVYYTGKTVRICISKDIIKSISKK